MIGRHWLFNYFSLRTWAKCLHRGTPPLGDFLALKILRTSNALGEWFRLQGFKALADIGQRQGLGNRPVESINNCLWHSSGGPNSVPTRDIEASHAFVFQGRNSRGIARPLFGGNRNSSKPTVLVSGPSLESTKIKPLWVKGCIGRALAALVINTVSEELA